MPPKQPKSEYNPYVDELTNGIIKRDLHIGFVSYWFTLEPNLDDFISKNALEAIYLKHLLKLGYVYFLGLSPRPFLVKDKRAINYATEIIKLPNWSRERFGTTPDYMRYCIENYDKPSVGITLPKLDFVFWNAMPTFVRRNARNYVVVHEYAIKQKVPVITYDLGLDIVGQGLKHLNDGGITEEFDEGKLMNISGYDYRDKAAHLKMKDKLVHIVQTGPWGIELLKRGNPLLRFSTWWLPYDREQLPCYKPRIDPNKFRYPIVYVGNDNRRRNSINKWFRNTPDKFVHIFGGNYRRDLGTFWPKEVTERYPNIVFHNPVPVKDVNRTYNRGIATLNISVPQFEKVGVQVWRHFEAPFGGSILLMPNTTYMAHKLCFGKEFVVQNTDHLIELVEYFRNRPAHRCELIMYQRRELKRRYTMEVNLRNLFSVISDEIE